MIEILDVEQGSEAWLQCRLGLPTASEFSSVLAKGEGKTRKSYMLRLAGEIITGVPAETFKSADMERGNAMEPEARQLYSFIADTDLQQVGFIRSGDKGCSPDSLIGKPGMLEIKTAKPALLCEAILADKFPTTHKAQCQGNLWIAEREWIDIAIYWPGMPLFVKRAERDEDYIKTLAEEVDRFNEELAECVAKVRRYGIPNLAEAA